MSIGVGTTAAPKTPSPGLWQGSPNRAIPGGDMGCEVQYLPVTPEEYAAELVTYGLSEEEAVPISELIAEVLDGRNSYLSDGVQQALGRPPRDFADYARDTAATGVWNLEAKAS